MRTRMAQKPSPRDDFWTLQRIPRALFFADRSRSSCRAAGFFAKASKERWFSGASRANRPLFISSESPGSFPRRRMHAGWLAIIFCLFACAGLPNSRTDCAGCPRRETSKCEALAVWFSGGEYPQDFYSPVSKCFHLLIFLILDASNSRLCTRREVVLGSISWIHILSSPS